ncbi:fatty acid desaturase family protein [Mycobacterium montefiorense]|uniref:Stearoyl-CoA 9-desaturase n=1 Tax=Mycobacterium montefiorense TaxID=154654 RepID=A0AA37UV97_9MYCO|nr:fatty acid desaturase [Mycobacterium montefiorense]GBG39743.1 stearoyl-CoA 9-desaturase [Mycobacterium montefiorense]GKU35614.1 stearoyl-CoA 9-desaturase [Mycobacterium montefiorense]GKU40619.1 stearoyl-CoA 9-desaturase [Mycobacterium montefiorense]GKU45122.1 stearoyl-CoA 9-desaturase [Mycobacterium montefiorense]GKU51272.1 stearoyl-CoA 9-desaturase [Mycobacterium montefiorense]
MAITDVKQYAHLRAEDVEALGRELDAIRADIEESRGERDARYIRRAVQLQRALVVGARIVLMASRNKYAWTAGTAMLGTGKIIENMELGHNITHGQWDWMNDPEIHSTEWEWDTTSPSVHWKKSHNFIHHKYTNIVGMDDDVGYGIMRVTRDEPWARWMLGNPIYNLLLGTLFEWGVAAHGLELSAVRRHDKTWAQVRKDLKIIARKVGKQVGKDYVVFPALAGRNWKHTLRANAVANLIRNYWSYMVIFCGHFPDGAEKFTKEEFENETQGEWYLRQMLGSANFNAGPLLAFISGNLCYQIEHHLFPDLPSNRYAEISVRVRELCEKYDLPYTTGSLGRQYWQSFWTIFKLALPDKLLKGTPDDAPETNSELKFRVRDGLRESFVDPATGKRRGLRTALRDLQAGRVAA